MTAKLEMIVRFADGTGRTLHSVEDSPRNRRTVDRMAAHLLAKPNVDRIEVAVRTGRTAGYERSKSMKTDSPLAPARGIALAVLLSLPFWALAIWAVVR